jgi:hypothetical protein
LRTAVLRVDDDGVDVLIKALLGFGLPQVSRFAWQQVVGRQDLRCTSGKEVTVQGLDGAR